LARASKVGAGAPANSLDAGFPNVNRAQGILPRQAGAGIIKLDLYIAEATVPGTGGIGDGNNRGLVPNADPTQSKVQIFFDPSNGRCVAYVNGSCVGTYHGPYSHCFNPRPVDVDKPGLLDLAESSARDHTVVTAVGSDDKGGYNLMYNFVNAAPGGQVLGEIGGIVQFRPRGGSYSINGPTKFHVGGITHYPTAVLSNVDSQGQAHPFYVRPEGSIGGLDDTPQQLDPVHVNSGP